MSIELKKSRFHCEYCGDTHYFDMTNPQEKEIADYWDDWHSSCRKRITEAKILKAMRAPKRNIRNNEYDENPEEDLSQIVPNKFKKGEVK